MLVFVACIVLETIEKSTKKTEVGNCALQIHLSLSVLVSYLYIACLQDSKLGEVVEPMVWVYVEDVDRFVDSLTWANYGEVFNHIWAASAYKGAFGERLYAVNVQRHVGKDVK